MIKLVAMDMDGTLLDSSKELPEENRKTIELYAQKGVQFAFCTGRVMNELQVISKELPCVKYAITCNGAYVNDFTLGSNDNEIFNDTLSMEEIRHIFDIVSNKGYEVMFELQADGVVYAQKSCIDNPGKYGVDYLADFIKLTRVPVESMEEYVNSREIEVGKVNMFFANSAMRNSALEELKDLDYDFSYSEGANLEINKRGVNKGKGLKMLAEYLGISLDEVMALGDNYNDIEMLKTTKNSVVMANAVDEIKAVAMYETLSNDENGVAAAIRKFC